MNTIIPLVKVDLKYLAKSAIEASLQSTESLEVEFINVNLAKYKLHPSVIAKIETCEGVDDRSSTMLGVAMAMLKAQMTDQEIISVLTDKNNALALAALERRKTRKKAADWVNSYVLKRAKELSSASAIFGNLDSENREKNWNELTNTLGLSLVFEDFKNIELDTSATYLVQDYIDHAAFCIMYGPSNSGKTFLALDTIV